MKDRGSSLVEYGMLAGLISVASIGAVVGVGERTEETFCRAAEAIHYRLTGGTPDCITDIGLSPRFGDLFGNGSDQSENKVPEDIRLDGSGVTEYADLGPRDIGEQGFGVAVPPGGFPGNGPFRVVVSSDDDVVAACTGSGGELDNCSGFGSNGSIDLRPGDTHFGYRVNIPDDPRAGTDISVNVKVIDADTGNIVFEEDGDVLKEPSSISASPPEHLGHYDIPLGSTGNYYVWAPIFDFNSPFMLFINDRVGNLPAQSEPCTLSFEDEIHCYSSNVTMRPEEHKAIGFRIDKLPDSKTSVASYNASLTFRSLIDSSISYTLEATAEREPEPILVSLGGTFTGSATIPGGVRKAYVRREFKGEMNDWSLLRVSASNQAGAGAVKACYWKTEFSAPTCEYKHGWGAQMNFFSHPHSIGIELSGLSQEPSANFSADYTFVLSSRRDGSYVSEPETLTVRR